MLKRPTTPPHLKEFTEFLAAFNKESERGSVLIAMSMIEDMLGQIISSFLIDAPAVSRLLEGFNAPLGTLSARSLCAFALGLLSEDEYRECDHLRKIRNEFAHHIHTSFKDQAIKDHCKNLRLAIKNGDPKSRSYVRSLFITSAVCLILNLTNRAAYAKKERLSQPEWPY